MIFQQELQGPM